MVGKKRVAEEPAPSSQEVAPVKRPKRVDPNNSITVEASPILMAIPRELRDMIWEEVVHAAGSICRWAPNLRTRCRCSKKFVHRRMSVRSKALSLLQTNKQFYEEAIQIFLLRNKFIFSLHELHGHLPLVLKVIPRAREVTISFDVDPTFSARSHMYDCVVPTYSRKPENFYRSALGSWTHSFLSPLAAKLTETHRLKHLKLILRSDAQEFYKPVSGSGINNKQATRVGRIPWNTRLALEPFENIRGLSSLKIIMADRKDLSEDELGDLDTYASALTKVAVMEPGTTIDPLLMAELASSTVTRVDMV